MTTTTSHFIIYGTYKIMSDASGLKTFLDTAGPGLSVRVPFLSLRGDPYDYADRSKSVNTMRFY